MQTDHTQKPCLDRRYYRESSPGVYELTEDGYYKITWGTKNPMDDVYKDAFESCKSSIFLPLGKHGI